MAPPQVSKESPVGAGQLRHAGTAAAAGCRDELDELSRGDLDLAARDGAEADPRSPQIAEHREGKAEFRLDRPHPCEVRRMLLEGAVAEVQAKDARARLDDRPQAAGILDRGAERGHDPRERASLGGGSGGPAAPRHERSSDAASSRISR